MNKNEKTSKEKVNTNDKTEKLKKVKVVKKKN